MHVVAIRVQQTNGNRFGARIRDLPAQSFGIGRPESALDGSIEQHTFIDTETEIAGDEGARRRRGEVIKLRTILSADG